MLRKLIRLLYRLFMLGIFCFLTLTFYKAGNSLMKYWIQDSVVRTVKSSEKFNATCQDVNSGKRYVKTHRIPKWQVDLRKRQEGASRRYNLTEALSVRIYESDKAKWTLRELKQWLHYVFWAGVQHVYLCDNYILDDERLEEKLGRYIEDKLITYIPRREQSHVREHQFECYAIIHEKYGALTRWHMAIDMDEYPFCPNDTREGFLLRYLDRFENTNTGQIAMENYHLLGQGDRNRDMAIDRLERIDRWPGSSMNKPIYKPETVLSSKIRKMSMRKGWRQITANPKELRVLHLWGARTQKWGPDTPTVIKKTIPFTLVRKNLVNYVRNSLLCYGERDAFSNITGP